MLIGLKIAGFEDNSIIISRPKRDKLKQKVEFFEKNLKKGILFSK
jgi:hypothetical protein